MLQLLPDITFPVSHRHADRLNDDIAQLNILDAGVTEGKQRGLSLYFHTFDLWCKSGGKIDYRGEAGHARLVEDAMRFVGSGNSVSTKHGDLAAAHLALDWHDCQMRLKAAGQPLLSFDVNQLLVECAKLCEYPIELEKRTGLLMDFLGKRKLV